MALSAPVPGPADTVEEVLASLTEIVEWSREARSRIGYFAALYRRVTRAVADGIRAGAFDDGPRMERFDVCFANRYLAAVAAYHTGAPPGACWALSFDLCGRYWPIVLQHLLLGMNAHINLDLGVSAAETMRGRDVTDLHGDFDRINEVLASLVDDVQRRLSDVWIALRLFNRVLGSADDALVNFSMEAARDEAWRTAERFARAPEAEWPAAIAEQDRKMERFARVIVHPGVLLATVTKVVRVGEVQDVARVIDILA